MENIKNIINEYEQWIDSMNEDCPQIAIDALALMKQQKQEYDQLQGWATGHGITLCKDCKHYVGSGWCYITRIMQPEEFFCAYGEPRSTNAPSDTDTTYPVPQSDIATIMNRINEGLDGTGYIAEGFENTDTFLHVLVNREVCGQ